MPNVIHLSAREKADLAGIAAIELQTGSPSIVGEPDLTAPCTFYPAHSITVEGPGRVKYWLRGEVGAPTEAARGDAGDSTGSYEARTAKELRVLARERGLTGYSKLNKTALIAALRKAE
jgi:Rho termination factor, N-terminal domain